MSPRRNRPSRSLRREPPPIDPERARRGVDTVETWRQERWWVRHIPASAAGKTYRCPGCEQEIRPGVAHVVAWPAEGVLTDVADRRHWHAACWRARDRRRPGPG